MIGEDEEILERPGRLLNISFSPLPTEPLAKNESENSKGADPRAGGRLKKKRKQGVRNSFHDRVGERGESFVNEGGKGVCHRSGIRPSEKDSQGSSSKIKKREVNQGVQSINDPAEGQEGISMRKIGL